MTWTKPTLVLIALCEFLVAVDSLLPSYWYSIKGGGLESLSSIIGVSSKTLEAILKEAGILKPHGNDLRFHKDVFYGGFPLLDGLTRPSSIEHTQTRLNKPSRRTRSNKHKKGGNGTRQHFIRIGSGTSARNWPNLNVQQQRDMELSPPRASIAIQRDLFLSCQVIADIIDETKESAGQSKDESSSSESSSEESESDDDSSDSDVEASVNKEGTGEQPTMKRPRVLLDEQESANRRTNASGRHVGGAKLGSKCAHAIIREWLQP
jgi:hypothetical protein